MAPRCIIDVKGIRPTLLLRTSQDGETCRIRQRITVTELAGDSHGLRDLKMVVYFLEQPPIVEFVSTDGTYDLLFDPDTELDTIPSLVEMIIERLATRREDRKLVRQHGPTLATNGDLSDRQAAHVDR